MTHHIIKSLAVLTLSVMLIGTASAQENEAGKQKINPWIEFNLGVSFLDGSDGFNDHMQTYHPTLDYRSAYSAAAQIGVGLGMEYRRFTLGIHLNGMADNILSVKNQLVKKQDNLYHLDLGYIISVGQVGKAHITGLDTEVDDLNFLPATLTLGWKYRF